MTEVPPTKYIPTGPLEFSPQVPQLTGPIIIEPKATAAPSSSNALAAVVKKVRKQRRPRKLKKKGASRKGKKRGFARKGPRKGGVKKRRAPPKKRSRKGKKKGGRKKKGNKSAAWF